MPVFTRFHSYRIQLISIPTRLTSYSATLIDNIFTNHLSTLVFTGIVLNDLSGHFPICAHFYGEVLPHKREKKLLKRSFKEDNLNKFNESLTLTDWLKPFSLVETAKHG